MAENYVDDNMPNDQVIEDIFTARETIHADDAVDYEDIDELADDDELDLVDEDKNDNQSGEAEAAAEAQADQDFDDIFGEDNGLEMNNDHLMGDGMDYNMYDMYGDGLEAGDNLDVDVAADPVGVNDGVKAATSQRKRPVDDGTRQRKRAKLSKIVEKLEKRQQKRNLRYYFPKFTRSKPFNNHELFLPDPRFFQFSKPPIVYRPRPLIPTRLTLEPALDQKKVFKQNKYPSEYSFERNVTDITESDMRLLEKIQENGGVDTKKLVPLSYLANDGGTEKFKEYGNDMVLAVADWDDDSIINGNGQETKRIGTMLDLEQNEEEEDEEETIFNGNLGKDVIKLNMNDPNLLFERVTPKNDKYKQTALTPVNEKLLNLKYNVSNDKEYEIFKTNYNVKVRSQIGNLNIEHSIPALRLQSPYYRVKLKTEDARNFHRPKFEVRPGTLVSFLKIKQRKKKKDKGKTSKELFTKTTDLTAGDNATMIVMEYAEEYPLILSNYGMGSKLINYYRREKPEDNYRPKAPLGETHVLGVEDRSPFWNFGYVKKGDFVPTLYNNMIRAPIFNHEHKSTDFVLIRSQGGGNHQKYYLKNMDHIFGVGHTFPSVEVPAPHSRKVTNTSKNRLKMIVFRTMNKKGKARINVKDISHHFPDQNDMQNRQRLKEFMEYQRSGEDQYYWKIKGRDTAPDEESIRMMITPEDVTLLDSMQAGQQVLNDLTIFLNEEQERAKANKEKIQELEAEKDEQTSMTAKERREKKKEKKEDAEEGIDEQLTCWNLTRNFMLANQTKAMLQLNGEGDPTGIGIGYSMLKTSQRNSFMPLNPPPKENVPKSNQAAYQQRLYEQEITRIWNAQKKSLMVDKGDSLDQIYSQYKPVDHKRYLRKKYEDANNDLAKDNKVLRINRRSRDKNGIVQRKIEVIKDPRVIKAYLKRKKLIEDELIKNANLEDIIPTNDKELNKIRRKALEEKLANLERRAKHTKGKKSASGDLPLPDAGNGDGKPVNGNTVVLPDGSLAIGGKGIGKGNSTGRRCKACGAFGHIRTKKLCPLYKQTKESMDLEATPTDPL